MKGGSYVQKKDGTLERVEHTAPAQGRTARAKPGSAKPQPAAAKRAAAKRGNDGDTPSTIED